MFERWWLIKFIKFIWLIILMSVLEDQSLMIMCPVFGDLEEILVLHDGC